MKRISISNRPGIAKMGQTGDKGEHKVRPYKGFPVQRRGEPCVHPSFPDSLVRRTLSLVRVHRPGGMNSRTRRKGFTYP